MGHRRTAGHCITAMREEVQQDAAAGLGSLLSDMSSLMQAEMALNIDKKRVSPRVHANMKVKYLDCVKTTENPAGDSASSPRSVASTLGSPRGTSNFRGISAGKLVASMRYDVGRTLGSPQSRRENRISWPHRRGSVDAFASMQQKSIVSPMVSPRSARDNSPIGFLHDAPSNHIVWGTSSSSSWKTCKSAASSAPIAVNVANTLESDGKARQLFARRRDNAWAERSSRLFPAHLATPRPRSNSPTPAMSQHLMSSNNASTRARSNGPELRRETGKNARYQKGEIEQSKKMILKQVLLPAQQGGIASNSARSTASLSKAAKTDAERAKQTDSGTNFKSSARLATLAATSTRPTSTLSSNKADFASRDRLQRLSPDKTWASTDAVSNSGSSSRASRLQDLRSKLEKSLEAAEDTLHKDLEFLDQRLGVARNKSNTLS